MAWVRDCVNTGNTADSCIRKSALFAQNTIKRYAEYNEIGERNVAAAYRKSFAYYTSERLLVSIMFYGSSAMLFLGAFVMRYRLEMILAFPLVALVMAMYLDLSFKEDSAAQRPEGLYREPKLMAAVLPGTNGALAHNQP